MFFHIAPCRVILENSHTVTLLVVLHNGCRTATSLLPVGPPPHLMIALSVIFALLCSDAPPCTLLPPSTTCRHHVVLSLASVMLCGPLRHPEHLRETVIHLQLPKRVPQLSLHRPDKADNHPHPGIKKRKEKKKL
jgi:hypothetical protein